MKRTISRIGLFALVAVLLAPAAWAQGNQQPQAPDVEVDDAELETVAQVYVDIEPIQREYRAKMQQAQKDKDREKFMTLRKEFQQEVNATLDEEEDLTLSRFNKIMRAAQTDQELQGRLKSAIQSARGSSENSGNDGGGNNP